jgi:signal transduction histidine kinase
MSDQVPASSTAPAEPAFDLAAALRLFDETTGALAAQVARLEQILVAKQAELSAANARLAAVMSGVASGVVAIGLDGLVATANPAACAAISGLAVGADWRILAPDSPALRILAGDPGPVRAERTHGHGPERRFLVAQASALRDQEGRLNGAVEVFDDVTGMRQLAERAERADRLKQLGEMAAGVAHEIRNPLNGIEGFASLLVRDLPDGDKRRRFAQLIVEGVRDLNHTVTGLLEFTRQRRLERRPHDPVDLVRSVVEITQADAANGSVDIAIDNRWDPAVRLQADGPQLKQVLLNLVRNAVEAAAEAHPGAGRVAIAIEATTEGVVVTVDDDGPGVPAEARQLVFTPFHTTKDHGTGLGLAVAYAIVQLHGGSLTVLDGPLGGARFRVSVPLQ